MNYVNFAGDTVEYWWPIFRSYEECRVVADLLTTTIERFNGGSVVYALCHAA